MCVDPAQIPATLMAPAMDAGQPPAVTGLRAGQLVRVIRSGASDGTYRVTEAAPDGIGCWTWTLEPVADEAST